MLAKLQNLIKRATIVTVLNDAGNFPVVQASYFEKTANVEHITPYGVYSNPPLKSQGIVMNILGQEENKIGFFNLPYSRFKNLKPGEVAFGNPLTGSHIKFSETGDVIEIAKGGKSITVDEDFNITVNGNVAINATNASITATTLASITAPTIQLGNGSGGAPVSLAQFAALKTAFDDHVHNGVQTGSGNTGAPTSPLPAGVGTSVVTGE